MLGQYGRGGTETQAQLLVRGLRSRGVDVDVFVVEDGTGPDGHDFGDAPVTRLGAGRGRGVADASGLCLAAARLGRSLHRRRYHVVHAALARAYVLAPVVAPWRHRPHIVVWRRNLGDHLRARQPRTVLDTAAARLSDVVVANSEAVRRHWVAQGIPAARTRVIRNALEPWRFDTVPPRAPDDGTVRLVTVGGLRPVKGHDVLLAAAGRLAAESVPVEVVVVGDGPRRRALAEQADRLGVPLVLPGHQADPRPWLAAGTVYVHPSHSEGASNAIAEAMAQGCAVVATDVGGAAEMLGPDGLLVRPGDVSGLAATLRTVIADPDLRRDLGERARGRARALFAMDQVIDQHLDVYAGG
ncbi:Glycosyltransferase involved in cell wall bisynthesis [Micromonospora auratinigra]|uniref:Glycosyltransferase involved in cell wall bisynthesis n=1 Tax=Micromonospora auratinigra TaxID=261654 RepID=A0A1A8Z1J2_9ACTN|nr:Glycosyltransferase involved in cell wall bisynthesis [Micromonospora auratinigra]